MPRATYSSPGDGDAVPMFSRSLSVVVPAFDEADCIGLCLDLLCEQLDCITEIIVVDNNSTDDTGDIVKRRAAEHPEIRYMTETQQGLVFARNAGLDAASGDIVARIDADTRVPPDWAATVLAFFEDDVDGAWAAACGRGEAYDLPYGDAAARLKSRLSPLARRTPSTPEVRDVPVLYGSNMILRQQTWKAIRDGVSLRRDVFEDVDMGLCVQETGGRNAFLPSITVGVSPRRMESGMRSFVRYMACLPRTLLLHRRYALALGALTLYVPAVSVLHACRLIMIRAYDKDTGTFSPAGVLRPRVDRAMP